jgi:hypothetical protein
VGDKDDIRQLFPSTGIISLIACSISFAASAK